MKKVYKVVKGNRHFDRDLYKVHDDLTKMIETERLGPCIVKAAKNYKITLIVEEVKK